MKWAKRSSSPWWGVAVSRRTWSACVVSRLGELVTLGLLRLVAARGDVLGVGAALVGLVNDDEVPALLPDALADVVLLGVVNGGDDLVGPLPGIGELLLVHGREDDVERLAEPAQHFVLPLDRQRRRAEDEDAVNGLAEFHFLDEQPGHDRFAGAGVVGEQEAQAGLRQHLHVDRFDLVRQRADAGEADGELAIVGVGEPDAGGFDEQAKVVGVGGGSRRCVLPLSPARAWASSSEMTVSSSAPDARRTRHSKPPPSGRTDSSTTGSAKCPGSSIRWPMGKRSSGMTMRASRNKTW